MCKVPQGAKSAGGGWGVGVVGHTTLRVAALHVTSLSQIRITAPAWSYPPTQARPLLRQQHVRLSLRQPRPDINDISSCHGTAAVCCFCVKFSSPPCAAAPHTRPVFSNHHHVSRFNLVCSVACDVHQNNAFNFIYSLSLPSGRAEHLERHAHHAVPGRVTCVFHVPRITFTRHFVG